MQGLQSSDARSWILLPNASVPNTPGAHMPLQCLPDIRGSEEASGEALPLAWCHGPGRAILVGADGRVGTLETTLYPAGDPRAVTSPPFFLPLFTRVRGRGVLRSWTSALRSFPKLFAHLFILYSSVLARV
jgi:hypothetical protein